MVLILNAINKNNEPLSRSVVEPLQKVDIPQTISFKSILLSLFTSK